MKNDNNFINTFCRVVHRIVRAALTIGSNRLFRSLIPTGARRHLAMCGMNQGGLKRRFDSTLGGGGSRLGQPDGLPAKGWYVASRWHG